MKKKHFWQKGCGATVQSPSPKYVTGSGACWYPVVYPHNIIPTLSSQQLAKTDSTIPANLQNIDIHCHSMITNFWILFLRGAVSQKISFVFHYSACEQAIQNLNHHKFLQTDSKKKNLGGIRPWLRETWHLHRNHQTIHKHSISEEQTRKSC